MRSNLFPVKS